MEVKAFLERVVRRLPASRPTGFTFEHWHESGRPTDDGLALLPLPGLVAADVLAAILDLDHYVGNIQHVAISRTVADPRFSPPQTTRFYQKVEIPFLGAIQQELVMHKLGEHRGYQVIGWELLGPETDALNTKDGYRSDYNHGMWLVADGIIGYAIGSAPKRDDVGFLKWKALTTGADAAASKVVRENLEGMARWAARRHAA
jgi:hypothetical protein